MLALHVEENRSQVLEPDDILPYLNHVAGDDLYDDNDSPAETAPVWLKAKPVSVLPWERQRKFDWLDLVLVFTVSGIFWLVLCESTKLGGT